MRFVIAPDSFKESMSALRAAEAIARGLRKGLPGAECDLIPMADGGEGTAECLLAARGGKRIACRVCGPLGKPQDAWLLWFPESGTALVEVAMACGLALMDRDARDPMTASSYGVGQMIEAALSLGCRELLLALGGTGTNDGGLGMLQALGADIADRRGRSVGRGGAALREVASVYLDPARRKLENVRLTVLCDVRNPLLGPTGATYVFGPQKGASGDALPLLEEGMRAYASAVERAAGKSLSGLAGAGAAGGIGFALFTLGDARFESGSEYLMRAAGLEERIQACDCVITGEGSVDAQSLNGKAPVEVARLARKYGKPAVVFAGRIAGDPDAFYKEGITALLGIVPSLGPLEETLAKGEENLAVAAENAARLWSASAALERAPEG